MNDLILLICCFIVKVTSLNVTSWTTTIDESQVTTATPSVSSSSPLGIYLVYAQDSIDAPSLSVGVYASDLGHIFETSIIEFYSLTTSLSTVCNNTDINGIDCQSSNYNPFDSSTNNTRRRRRRRRMLNDQFSYHLEYDTLNDSKLLQSKSWWEGRIMNTYFCYVLSLAWDPYGCEWLEYSDPENYEAGYENAFVSYGEFDVVASEMPDVFQQFLVTSLRNETTKQVFLSIFNQTIYESNDSLYFSNDFQLYDVIIFDGITQGYPDDYFEAVAFDIAYIAYSIFAVGVLIVIVSVYEARFGCWCCNCCGSSYSKNQSEIGDKHSSVGTRRADNVYYGRIGYFFLFWIDILTNWSFAFWVIYFDENTLGVFSGVLILLALFGWAVNMHMLIKQIKMWQNDCLINKKLDSYLRYFRLNVYLLIGVITFGNTFGGILLLNSNMFGWKQTSMGLNKTEIKTFLMKRIKLSLIADHVPWIIAYCMYFTINPYAASGRFAVPFLLTIITFIDSILHFYHGRKYKQFEIENEIEETIYFVDICSDEIEFNKYTTYMRHQKIILKKFAENIEVNVAALEIFLCVPVDNGVEFMFKLRQPKSDDALSSLSSSPNGNNYEPKQTGHVINTIDKNASKTNSRIKEFIALYSMIYNINERQFMRDIMKEWDLKLMPTLINIGTLYNIENNLYAQRYNNDKNVLSSYNGSDLDYSKIKFIDRDVGAYSVIQISNWSNNDDNDVKDTLRGAIGEQHVQHGQQSNQAIEMQRVRSVDSQIDQDDVLVEG